MMIYLVGFIIISSKLWQQAAQHPEQTAYVRSGKLDQKTDNSPICILNAKQPFQLGPQCVFGMSVAAMLTGVLSGLFGVGGGFLIVPVLMFLTRISIQQAIATSLVVISLVSGSGFLSYLLAGNTIEPLVLVEVALGGLSGMIFGVLLGRYLAGPLLQKLFAVTLMLIGMLMLFKFI